MLPLFVLSLMTIALTTERLLVYRRWLSLSKERLAEIENSLHNGAIDQVHALCMKQHGLICRILDQGIKQKSTSPKHLEAFLKNEVQQAIAYLEARLAFLATVSGLAPMIGFLGTVVGMVKTFMALSDQQLQVFSVSFSKGLYEAMMTTIAGLIVGMLAYVAYHYCLARVQKVATQLEYVVNLLLCKM